MSEKGRINWIQSDNKWKRLDFFLNFNWFALFDRIDFFFGWCLYFIIYILLYTLNHFIFIYVEGIFDWQFQVIVNCRIVSDSKMFFCWIFVCVCLCACRIMESLNLLRYMLIRDKEWCNEVGDKQNLSSAEVCCVFQHAHCVSLSLCVCVCEILRQEYGMSSVQSRRISWSPCARVWTCPEHITRPSCRAWRRRRRRRTLQVRDDQHGLYLRQ